MSEFAQALQEGLTLGRRLLRQGRQQEIPDPSDFPCLLPLDGQRRECEAQSCRGQERSPVHQSSLGENRRSIRRMGTSVGMVAESSRTPRAGLALAGGRHEILMTAPRVAKNGVAES